MTIIDASHLVWNYLTNSDSIILPNDFIKLILITEDKEKDLITLKMALKDFEEGKILRYFYDEGNKKEYWILNKSLSAYEQNVTLSAITTDALSKIINKVCEKMKTNKDLCDAKNITEKDIQNLIVICNSLLENTEGKE